MEEKMLNRIKVLCVLALSMAVCAASYGVTVTVEKDGSGNFLTVQAALDSIDYNDGVNDLVIIGPGVYDQQFTPGGDQGADSTRYPNVFNMTPATVAAAFTSHTDNLTLRGRVANDPPVFTYVTGVDKTNQPYGTNPNDPSDFFEAMLVHCANNVTYDNIDIRHGTLGYAMNGMSAGTVFEDCLFTNGTTGAQGHDDYWDWNNNINITSAVDPTIGADNEYTFNNCTWNGLSTTGDSSLFDSTFMYFHAFDSIGQPNTFLGIGGTSFNGCVFRNWGDVICQIRGREELDRSVDYVHLVDCFGDNIANMTIMEGAVREGIVNRCVHKLAGQGASVRLEERDQGIYDTVVVANNIFSGTSTSGQSVRVDVRKDIRNGVVQNADWYIINNTFYGYNAPAITTHQTPAGSNTVDVRIANNLFHGDGSGTAVGINHAATGGTFTLSTNGYFGNAGGDVVGALTNSGAVTGDPSYAGGVTAVQIPARADGSVPVQGLNPTNAAYLNTGTQAAYDAVRAQAGDFDVDQTHTTLSGIDIGAQQNLPISVLDWSVY